MSDPLRLLDCQAEHGFEPVDPDADRMEYWHDEYGEPHPRVRRWRSVPAFALALLESAILYALMFVGVFAAWGLFWAVWVELP